MNNKDKIIEVAQKLFIEKGLTGTSVKNILDECDVSNGCLFNYFKTKDEIAQNIYMELKKDFTEYCINEVGDAPYIREFLWLYWKATIQWSLDHPEGKEFLKMFCNTPIINELYKKEIPDSCSFMQGKIQHAIDTKEIISIDYSYFIYTFVGITDGVIQYIFENPQSNSDEIMEKGFNQYWRMIVNF